MANPINPLNRDQVFQYFLDIERKDNSNQDHLSFLDKGSRTPVSGEEIRQYGKRLQQMPDGKTIATLANPLLLTGSNKSVSFKPPLPRGTVPLIDETDGLAFLHPDIKAACVCVGTWVGNQIYSHWLGRDALENRQLWSATKIVPLLNVLCRANEASAQTPIQQCLIHDPQKLKPDISFGDVAIDIISYRNGESDSNQKANMMKRFSSLSDLEAWLRRVTGSKDLEFRDYYGDSAYIAQPTLQIGTTPLLTAPPAGEQGNNFVSVYDLTRLLTLLGWHWRLPGEAKLPSAQWHSLDTLAQAMGYDTARYVDVALDLLELRNQISAPVILSKLGFGPTSLRQRTELVYSAFVQLVDERPRKQNKPALLRTFAFTLLGTAQKLTSAGDRDLDEEARYLDARMATEVTELLRRLLAQELA